MKTTAIATLASLTLLTGCIEAILGGATAVGTSAMEERSLGDNIDDRSISTEINHFYLGSKQEHLLKDVTVRVHEGRVLLTGRTASTDVAIEAVRLAWLAHGVREVINEIKVGQEGTNLLNYARDNAIETQVEARLLATKNIRSVNYTVEVVDGVAYILGVAQDDAERQRVARIASVSQGVNKVVSYARLKNAPTRVEKTGKPRDPNINRSRGDFY